jgi:hypothetical protein
MKPSRWDAWAAQEPSPGFADRTVAAALVARRRGRRAAARRWMALGALAAMFVTAGAWAFASLLPRRAASPTPESVMPPIASHPVDLVRPGHLAEVNDVSSAPPRPAPRDEAHKRPAPAATVEPRPVGAMAPDAGRQVIRPRCDCAPDQVMCTCF